ncbi:MAG: hypothetical protein LBF38_03265 [Deltaproteobacteria bacterium]|nr:hypothetical protein [Deltaproteobacteria bacterium]
MNLILSQTKSSLIDARYLRFFSDSLKRHGLVPTFPNQSIHDPIKPFGESPYGDTPREESSYGGSTISRINSGFFIDVFNPNDVKILPGHRQELLDLTA